MEINVEVISREIIKPSSPTHKTYQLSLFDQFVNPTYRPFIYFYTVEGVSKVKISDGLKESLSSTITNFYPTAGRVKDNFSAICNGQGVEYVEAQVTAGNLLDVLRCPQTDVLQQFLPCEQDDKSGFLLAVQVNMFNCGGLAIGVCFSHKIFDGFSNCMFMKSWAATARGDENNVVYPNFNASSIFLPEPNFAQVKSAPAPPAKKFITKWFKFDASNIAALKEKIASKSKLESGTISRVEAVTALIWKCILSASLSSSQALSKPSMTVLLFAVNLRKKMVPPLPENIFGNLVNLADVISNSNTEVELHEFLDQLRQSVKRVNNDFVDCQARMIRGSKGVSIMAQFKDMRTVLISSMCRMGHYEVDFGWGKPAWVCFCASGIRCKNAVYMLDTKGGGIDACVNLAEEDMALFQCNPDLLEFVSNAVRV